MSSGPERGQFWLRLQSVVGSPAWWARLLLCVSAVGIVFVLVIDSKGAGLQGPMGTYGALATVFFVLVMGPAAAGRGSDSWILSRPGGRAEEVNRRALVIGTVAIWCSVVVGAIGFVSAPHLFRPQTIELHKVVWLHNSKNAFVGVEVEPRSEEERVCLDQWFSLRWDGSPECNDRVKQVFSGNSGPGPKTFIFASAKERDCIAQWSKHEAGKPVFGGMLEEKPRQRPEPGVTRIITGVSRYGYNGVWIGEAALGASTTSACQAFAAELARNSGRWDLIIADEPEVQPCFAHWQEALGREPTCWKPPTTLPVTLPPLGLFLTASFAAALFAGAMLRTALAPIGAGRLLTLAAVAVVLAAPFVWLSLGSRVGAGGVLGCACALAAGAYAASRVRWAKGDFQ
jgi:hypothetical protein